MTYQPTYHTIGPSPARGSADDLPDPTGLAAAARPVQMLLAFPSLPLTVLALPLLALLLTCGCQSGFHASYESVRVHMYRNDYQAAAKSLEADRDRVYRERDRVMYWLDRGLLLHYAGELEMSNREFIAAERAINELFTDSISRGVASMLTSPAVTHYEGEDYEKVLLYLYTALNNVFLGDLEDALVEVRRADERLKKLEVYYRQEGGLGTLYTQDAFLHWFDGMLFEEEGSHNDALISYRRAYEVYVKDYEPLYGVPPPSFLLEDIVRTATRVGFTDVVEAFLEKGGADNSVAAPDGYGELVVIAGLGESPYKTDLFVTGPAPGGHIVRAAIPELNMVPHATRSARIVAAGKSALSVLMEPVDAIALQNYAHRLSRTTALAIARAATKYAVARGLEAAGNAAAKDSVLAGIGSVVGLGASIVNLVTEEADKRSWRTLPAEFQVARLRLPPGQHTVQVEFLSAGQGILERQVLEEVTIVRGRRTFRSVRSLR